MYTLYTRTIHAVKGKCILHVLILFRYIIPTSNVTPQERYRLKKICTTSNGYYLGMIFILFRNCCVAYIRNPTGKVHLYFRQTLYGVTTLSNVKIRAFTLVCFTLKTYYFTVLHVYGHVAHMEGYLSCGIDTVRNVQQQTNHRGETL